ncbi:hypothetical protein M2262_003185 [Pseudomonas sp. BIGb0408]|uniref:Uncharacterized protein n=1 Tax=Phytopseudomonas flavescens TaxID=29435 RepID=A0A7Y9XJ27_9GAMM|nr:hypothetical protein [Pseudomonas sp. BIGb0408]NYH72295.1 hypothetical protein [Pseudomonas flavescens]
MISLAFYAGGSGKRIIVLEVYRTWRMWLDASGYGHIPTDHGLGVNNSAAVLQAAIDSHGRSQRDGA